MAPLPKSVSFFIAVVISDGRELREGRVCLGLQVKGALHHGRWVVVWQECGWLVPWSGNRKVNARFQLTFFVLRTHPMEWCHLQLRRACLPQLPD